MTVVDPVRDERGWAFRDGPGYTHRSGQWLPVLSEATCATDPNFDGRVTVPVLWDKQTRRIVNNSEDDICRMFNDAFARARQATAGPLSRRTSSRSRRSSRSSSTRTSTTAFIAPASPTRNAAYEKRAARVFAALDELEKRLATSRYLFGARIVEADWRLFCTLVRFDAVYHGHFKCNVRRIVDYPNLQGYLQDLYQQPGIAETVNFDHIKRHYYITHDDINPTRIVPIGPALDLTLPHQRGAL